MDILLVDDEVDILRSIEKVLADYGHSVYCAASAQEGLRLLSEHQNIGLIVSDIRMPGVNGIELLQMVRARYPSTPFLLMTGYGDEKIATQAFHAGAYDYLKKPVRMRDLVEIITRIEQRDELERQFFTDESPSRSEQDNTTREVLEDVLSILNAWEFMAKSIEEQVQRKTSDAGELLEGVVADLADLHQTVSAKVTEIREVIAQNEPIPILCETDPDEPDNVKSFPGRFHPQRN